MTEDINITHHCELCPTTVHTPAKDRTIGKVSRGYPNNWEQIKGKWCCPECAQGWHKKEQEAWNEYVKTRKPNVRP